MNEFSMTNETPIGFILIRTYPGCIRKVGAFEPFTTGEFLQYPGVWHPIYKAGKFEGETELHKFKFDITIEKIEAVKPAAVTIVIEYEKK